MLIVGKSVLVTGAARRIGAAIASALAARGAKVGIHYNHSKNEALALVEAIEKAGGQAWPIYGDMTRPADCARIVEEMVERSGALHILVNNAAVFFKTPLLTTTEEEWDILLDTNLKGPFFCAQAAARAMGQNGGKIVQIADWAAFRPYTDYLPYCISKAGLTALTKGLARTLAPHITVNAIALGAMLLPEPFDEEEKQTLIQNTPMRRLGSPEEVVEALLFLLEKGDFMTGSTLVLDGGRLIA